MLFACCFYEQLQPCLICSILGVLGPLVLAREVIIATSPYWQNHFALLTLCDSSNRFSIYGYWHNDFYKKSLELKTLKTKTEKDTKGLVG